MTDQPPPAEPRIFVTEHGPYRVVGNVAIYDAGGNLRSTTGSWCLCRCGGSRHKPFCDVTHGVKGFDGSEAADHAPISARRDSYAADGVTIYDDRTRCAHFGQCSGNLPAVFRAHAEPFVDPDGAPLSEITAVVAACPSGALAYAVGDDAEPVEQREPPSITPIVDGPYRVRGAIEVVGVDGRPYECRERQTLCRCGHSRNKPFCDGSHWYAGFRDPLPPELVKTLPSLYEWAGGLEALERLTAKFYGEILNEPDPILEPVFRGMDSAAVSDRGLVRRRSARTVTTATAFGARRRRPTPREPAMTVVHQHTSSPEGADVNAYLIEGADGVVAVDSTLTVSDSRGLRSRMDGLGKPLLAVVVTHAHPDHYGGLSELTAGLEVPILATAAVAETIRRDDARKEQILRPMFGEEWAARRTFPQTIARDGERVSFGDIDLTVLDLGPGESPADSAWLLGEDRLVVFPGDPMYDHKHGYLADGYYEQWLAIIARLQADLPPQATLHIGHGGPVAPADLAWQTGYIQTFVGAVQAADWSDPDAARVAVVAAVMHYLPTDELQFLMELSIDPVATQLGRLAAA